MSFSVQFRADVLVSNTGASTRSEFSLPLTNIKVGNSELQHPSTYTVSVAAASSRLIELNDLLKALTIKSTRPVAIFLVTDDKEYEVPPTTYYSLLIDSKEDVLIKPSGIRFEVPPEPVSAPNPRPANYPDALIEMFVLLRPAPPVEEEEVVV